MLLRTLGTFELLAPGEDGHPVRLMGPQKPLAMLAYIALAPGGRVSRDHLADLLWQNLAPERARRTLRQTLFALRQKVGDVLVADGEYLTLAAPIAVDRLHFDEACEQGRLEEAWRTYGGHFIADFASSGSAPFEHWCDRQRTRLRAAWFGVGEALVQAKLAGAPREAVEMAARLRDDDPSRADLRLLHIKALMLAGDRLVARAEAQQFEQLAQREHWRLGDESRRLREELIVDRALPVSDGRPWRRPELVGREIAFAALLTEWGATVGGRPGSVVVVRGSPGIGKTMLLDEFSARARGENGQVLVARARRVNTDTPYALMAELVDRLVELPGSLGVSPASADILVGLSPALSAVFRSATPRAHAADELLRLRTQALLELLVAVTDERALLLCIDDLHWADEASRQVLAKLGNLVNDRPLMLVLATRRTRGWVAPENARYVDLPPLSLEQVALLVTGVAHADAPLLHDIAVTINATSGGVPLLVVSALELCLERQLLTIEQEWWRCGSVEAFRRAIGQGGVLEKLLAGVSPAALNVLTALAVAEGALPEPVLMASVLPHAGAAVLDELVSRGLVVHGPAGVEIAHDELADAALAIVPPDQRSEVIRAVGAALLARPGGTAVSLALAGRLLAEVDDPRAADAFDRWLVMGNAPPRWRDPMRSAGEFLGAGATPRMLTRLARSVSVAKRVARGYPRARTFSAAFVALLPMLGLLLGRTALQPKAVAMQMVEPVSLDGFVWVTDTAAPIPVSLGVVFVDGRGLPTPRAPDSVTVSFETERGSGRLIGVTRRAVTNGRVKFDGLELSASALGRFVLRADDLPPVRSRQLALIRSPETARIEHLEITGGQLNGQTLDAVPHRVTVRPGAPITGMLKLRSFTTGTAAILAGAVALWGDRTRNFLTLMALPPNGRSEHTIVFEDKVDRLRELRAPMVPGTYPLLVVFAAETELRFVASGTNWLLREPVWNDGNDLADFTPEQVEALRRDGVVGNYRLIPSPDMKTIGRELRALTGTVIDVVVQP